MKSLKSWLESLSSREQRSAERQDPINLVAYYYDGGAPLAHDVLDISKSGLYLMTDERWYPGTVVRLTLQRVGIADNDPDRFISVNATVIRLGKDGVGLELLLRGKQPSRGDQNVAPYGADRKIFNRFLQMLLGNDSKVDK
jgi:hypothetical protein